MIKAPKKIKIGILFLLLIIVVAGAFYAGTRVGQNFNPSSEIIKASSSQTTAIANEGFSDDVDFSLFWDTVRIIKNKFYDAENIKDEKLLYGAIEGLFLPLDDPYSTFFDPSDAKKFYEDLNGNFGGIGAEIGIRGNQLLIIAPLKGNPAEEVGLKAGDKILEVNDKVTNNLSVEESVKMIRGEPGTIVKLLILRDGWKEAKEFKITRKIIEIPTLDWEMKPDGIAYFHLYNFNANAPQLLYEKALLTFLNNAKGIIFDLRNNPGGYLEVSTNIAGWFIKRGDVIVKEKFGSGEEKKLISNGNGAFLNLPVVVLINGGSASASEIFAGALRDNRGTKLIGEKTFGKGTVQEVETLKNGSVVKVSIAEWLTPGGHTINKRGLNPDIEIKMTDEDFEKKRDPQLDKAIEILKEEIAK